MDNKEINKKLLSMFISSHWGITIPFLDGTFNRTLDKLRELVSNGYRFYPSVIKSLTPLCVNKLEDVRCVILTEDRLGHDFEEYSRKNKVIAINYPFTVPVENYVVETFKDVWKEFTMHVFEEITARNITIIKTSNCTLNVESNIILDKFPLCKQIDYIKDEKKHRLIYTNKYKNKEWDILHTLSTRGLV